jgi:hypothetical protein
MEIDKITTAVKEREILLAELNAKLSEWEAGSRAWLEESEKWKVESHERAWQHQAYELVKYLEKMRGSHFNQEVSGPLQKAIVAMIADLPTNPPDPVAVRRREEARALAKQLAVPLSGATEDKLLRALETAIEAADEMQWKADAPMREAIARITNKTKREIL